MKMVNFSLASGSTEPGLTVFASHLPVRNQERLFDASFPSHTSRSPSWLTITHTTTFALRLKDSIMVLIPVAAYRRVTKVYWDKNAFPWLCSTQPFLGHSRRVSGSSDMLKSISISLS
jgi:hypothetical protein